MPCVPPPPPMGLEDGINRLSSVIENLEKTIQELTQKSQSVCLPDCPMKDEFNGDKNSTVQSSPAVERINSSIGRIATAEQDISRIISRLQL